MPNLRVETFPDDDHTYCKGDLGGAEVTLTVEPGFQDGFLSIWCKSPQPLPWATHVEFARAACAALNREVRCDPGAMGHSPYSDEFLSVGPEGERLITWTYVMSLWEFPLGYDDGTTVEQTVLAEGATDSQASAAALTHIRKHDPRLVITGSGQRVSSEVEARWREVAPPDPFPMIAPTTGRLALYARHG
ncbi:MAG: hypothetical protein AB7E79_12250 [Rhodospirillaceae bacterium]